MLLKLKADLDKLKTKLDADNANFEIEQAELKTIREDFIAGLSKFFKPSHDSSPSLLSTPLQDGEKTVEHGIFPSTREASIEDATTCGGKPSEEVEHGSFPSTKVANGVESTEPSLCARMMIWHQSHVSMRAT